MDIKNATKGKKKNEVQKIQITDYQNKTKQVKVRMAT